MAEPDFDPVLVRMECLRIAVEFGTQRDMLNPENLVERYYQVVTQGSGAIRPDDIRKDESRTKAQNSRNVRKGSVPQT